MSTSPSNQKINLFMIDAIQAWASQISKLMDDDAGSAPVDDSTYLTGELRMWHFNGFSPGYFTEEDGCWVFVADYLEK